MNYFVMHYASGEAFFSGILLIFAALALSFIDKKVWRIYISGVMCAFGAINIFASAIPIPVWLYWLFGILLLTQLTWGSSENIKKKYKYGLVIAIVLVLLLFLGLEIPWWISPKPIKLKSKTIFVIGDSISAGVGYKGEKTWADIIAVSKGINVINKSVGGGSAQSSIASLKKIKDIGSDDLVIVEIGGNDMFRNVDSHTFRLQLKKLLSNIKLKTSNIIMLELPLAPFFNGYGTAQRELSEELDVMLIPRSCFSYVLSGEKSTVDGLHLANFGHEKMAEIMSEYICF